MRRSAEAVRGIGHPERQVQHGLMAGLSNAKPLRWGVDQANPPCSRIGPSPRPDDPTTTFVTEGIEEGVADCRCGGPGKGRRAVRRHRSPAGSRARSCRRDPCPSRTEPARRRHPLVGEPRRGPDCIREDRRVGRRPLTGLRFRVGRPPLEPTPGPAVTHPGRLDGGVVAGQVGHDHPITGVGKRRDLVAPGVPEPRGAVQEHHQGPVPASTQCRSSPSPYPRLAPTCERLAPAVFQPPPGSLLRAS